MKGAIFKDEEVPRESTQFTKINQLWFEDKHASRTEVQLFADNNTSIT